jgi:hypothetical protein
MRPLLPVALMAAIAAAVVAETTRADPPAPSPSGARPADPTSISADVMVLHGTNDASGIDPQLRDVRVLGKPPFSSFNSYKLLSRTPSPLTLDRSKATTFKLPSGRELSLAYKQFVPPENKAAARYLVSASIQKPDGKSFLPLVEFNAVQGEWFWVGGQEYKGGALFIGIRIAP